MRNTMILLAGLSLAVLGPPGLAQSESSRLVRYDRPLKLVTIDLETGEVRRGPRVTPRAFSESSDLDNLSLGGFLLLDTDNAGCEWIESARKGGTNGNPPIPSDLVSSFAFAYCSQAADLNSGGVGGSMTWTFYPSFTTGSPHPATSTAVASFSLTGLPANTANGCVSGQVSCYLAQVSLGNTPLPFADGQIGYSWTFDDACPGTMNAATGPFLACVLPDCSSVGPNPQDIDGFLDEYCPAGVGGVPPVPAIGPTFLSITMDLRELDVDATLGSYQGTTPGSLVNPDTLTTSPAILGQSWTATVTPQPTRTPGGALGGLFLVRVTDGGPPGSTIVLDLSAFLAGQGALPPGSDAPPSQLLNTGTVLGTVIGDWSAGPTSLPIPLNTNLLCLPWFAQAAVFGDLLGDGDSEVDAMFSSGSMGVVGAQ